MRLLSSITLLLLSLSLQAGDTRVPVVALPENGDLQFTFQARVRGEYRNNVFDFDDAANSVTDDSWLLHRIRLGIEWQPISWMHVSLQGQDVHESFSDRADIPGVMGAEGDAGAEMDFTVNANLNKHLDMLIGCSHFFAGAYLNDNRAGDDADFACLMLTLNY
ncbi:MAG: hypothetical protein ABL974_05910 [Prosthecobacter sp.]